jgi:hypothetical protein
MTVVVEEVKKETAAPPVEAVNEANDLKKRLEKLIADRQPSSEAAAKKAVQDVKPFWERTPDDFMKMPDMPKIRVKPKQQDPEADHQDDDQDQAQTENGQAKKKPTHELKMGAANTAVGMTQLTVRMILTPIINYKFKKKFTDNEINKIDEIVDKDEAALDDSDLQIKKKWKRLMATRDKKIQGITFDEQKEKDLHKAFYNYFDFTESTMSPGWYLAFALINAIGGSIVDVVTD